MKYIRTQSGLVASVSQLLPPSKGMPGGGEIWRLSLITTDGQRHTYAVCDSRQNAIEMYDFVVAFMRSSYSLLEFPATDGIRDDDGNEFWPVVYQDRNEGLDDADVAVVAVQGKIVVQGTEDAE